MNVKERLKRIVARSAGDDLERAEMAFDGMTSKQLDQQYGFGGNTRKQILEGLRKQRQEWQEVYNYVCSLQ